MSRRIALLCLLVPVQTASLAIAAPPTIHVAWGNPVPPESPTDYSVDSTDPDFLYVELKTGNSAWRIWSTDADNPNSIGDIGIISSPHPQNFAVKIEGNSSAPGARMVKGIVLDPQGTGSDANYSNITGGRITGDLHGNLTLQRSSGAAGGEAILVINGNVPDTSTLTIPVLKSLQIDGDIEGDISVTNRIDSNGTLVINGNVSKSAVIEVAQISGGGTAILIGDDPADEFNGSLILNGSIPAETNVGIAGTLTAGGKIDLSGHDIYGGLGVLKGSGKIVNGGIVRSAGQISFNFTVPSGSEPFSGQLTVGAVEDGGIISVEIGSPSAQFTIEGNLDGTVFIDRGGLASGGKIEVSGNVGSTGNITFSSDCDDAAGNLEGDIEVKGNMNGSITLCDHIIGDIGIGEDLSGSILVGKSLKSSGRILIDGLCNGAIQIARETESLSLIRATDGLGSGGSVRINDSRGDYDARGVIHLSTTASIIPTPPPNVTFDGSIKVLRNTGNTDGGDLIGGITVIGCHASSADLDICICGTNSGHVEITQTQCSNQVAWSCVSGCN